MAILAAVLVEIPISEYSPREVKKSVTGKGSASKEQVSYMIQNILDIKETPDFLDVTDALAVAVCHALKMGSISKGSKSWKEYIKEHPEKVV